MVAAALAALAALGAIAGTGIRAQPAAPPPALSSKVLAEAWDREHLPSPLPPLLSHADVVAAVRHATDGAADLVRSDVAGQSVEGRDIYHLWFGRGPMTVLLWSQMHGDEPTATAALFDLVEYVKIDRGEPAVARWLEALTIHVVPMLNPDGAARRQRRNAQGLDINRDALGQQTPEGRLLKVLRDRLRPAIAFNLHDQSWRTSTGTPPRPAAISLLAVAYDEARSENEGRRLTKRVCAVVRDAVEPLAPGMVGRYDDEFEVRAFGDNLTRWGTPVVLIETGPYPSREPDQALVRLNFVALTSAIDALATGRVRDADPQRYETLPLNAERLFFTLVTHASVAAGTGLLPFIADIGIGASRVVVERDGRPQVSWSARIADLGDLRVYGALERIDATGLIAAPLYDTAVKPGDVVALPIRSTGLTIAVGQPGDLMLLRPAAAGKYRVERVIRY